VLAARREKDIRALGVRYGQPNADNEIAAAGSAALAIGVSFTTIATADALLVGRGLLAGGMVGTDAAGLSRAFVPARNAFLLSVAAAHGATWFDGAFSIMVGFNAEDCDAFPDCRPEFVSSMSTALTVGLARPCIVMNPWNNLSKFGILKYGWEPEELRIIASSWSCYIGGRHPCGECDACIKRAAAFAEAGYDDLSSGVRLLGGDVHRRSLLARR
jgi:7-cyano-7-deazaguanine synthase